MSNPSHSTTPHGKIVGWPLILLILVVVLVIFGIAGRLEKYLMRWN